MKILCCIESFLPGNKGGGPVRALDNLIHWLSPEHEFHVLTRNHDYLESTAYVEVPPGQWIRRDEMSICYAEDADILAAFIGTVKAVQPDWIYLHGALPPLTRQVLHLRQKDTVLAKIPVLLAPHGNFGLGALQHHRWRKQAWFAYAKVRGLYRGVCWHAASEREADQIRSLFGASAQLRVVPMAPAREVGKCECADVEMRGNMTEAAHGPATNNQQLTTPNTLRLVYFGRLSPEKNLPFAFELLQRFAKQHPGASVVYDLYHLGDADPQLKQLAEALPASVQVNFIAGLSHDALQTRLRASLFSSIKNSPPCLEGGNSSTSLPSDFSTSIASHSSPYHALLMPSLTENFSYTVLESLQAGIPVLISDQTPWRNLEPAGVGWDLDLSDMQSWLDCLDYLLRASTEEKQMRMGACCSYANAWSSSYALQAKELFR